MRHSPAHQRSIPSFISLDPGRRPKMTIIVVHAREVLTREPDTV